MKKFLALAALAAVSATPSFAQTVATWTFETTSNSITGSSTSLGPIAADSGSGSASGVHASSAAWSHPSGNGSPSSFSVNTWATGDYWQFQTSTLGFSGLSLSYDQTGSGTGPRDFALSYSVNGGSTFTTIGSTYSVSLSTWNPTTPAVGFTQTYNLGSFSDIDNASSVIFRISNMDTTSINGGSVASGGTDRIDNFSVFTTPVPEPSTFAIGIVGGLTALAAWKRKK